MISSRLGAAALDTAIECARRGDSVDADAAHGLAFATDDEKLTQAAAGLRDAAHGGLITYSRKVFIPLTKLCRNVCHYCTFARQPHGGTSPYLTIDEVLAIARAGEAAGCKEALFTLGDKPELRFEQARRSLEQLGHASTLAYLAEAAAAVLKHTSLLPHLNPGLMSGDDIAMLRPVAVSMGLMLESCSTRLCERGGPHFGSPDKAPAARLATLNAAGAHGVPMTSGILIGIGETRHERIDALLALRELHRRHGNLQETIVQNFRAKHGTPMASAAEPNESELTWTIAVARLILGADANIQAPPNLAPGALSRLIAAGINDWGGVSPITPDHVNPEKPWPELARLAHETAAAGKHLVERLAIYPRHALQAWHWVHPAVVPRVLNAIDAQGLARTDGWRTGVPGPLPPSNVSIGGKSAELGRIARRARDGKRLGIQEIAQLFDARDDAFEDVCAAADELRRSVAGDAITYVVNRNINYTNICSYRCHFCAFSKGKTSDLLRGRPYVLDLEEIGRRVREAWARGATEVCMQGGIHPSYTGATYLDIVRTAKEAAPDIHIHAFSPLEILHGAGSLGLSIPEYLRRLRNAGLGSLPGTAAEILDDEVRRVICPDKLSTVQWLEVIGAAHEIGLRTTATIMFGHVDSAVHWARHIDLIRALQEETGGFTEFVPLPFVAQEAPIYLKGGARPGPTYREAVLMHAVARLALHPVIQNIQTSWVKMGPQGAAACLLAGANDLGGTLMNESITRAAGATHGQEMAPAEMERISAGIGRYARVRTTLYAEAPRERITAANMAPPLALVNVSGYPPQKSAIAVATRGR